MTPITKFISNILALLLITASFCFLISYYSFNTGFEDIASISCFLIGFFIPWYGLNLIYKSNKLDLTHIK